jgi:hypothetical protein
VNYASWGQLIKVVVSHSRSFVLLSDGYLSSSGREKNLECRWSRPMAASYKSRGCSFGTDESSIDLHPGLKHAFDTASNRVSGMEIPNKIGDRCRMQRRSCALRILQR